MGVGLFNGVFQGGLRAQKLAPPVLSSVSTPGLFNRVLNTEQPPWCTEPGGKVLKVLKVFLIWSKNFGIFFLSLCEDWASPAGHAGSGNKKFFRKRRRKVAAHSQVLDGSRIQVCTTEEYILTKV